MSKKVFKLRLLAVVLALAMVMSFLPWGLMNSYADVTPNNNGMIGVNLGDVLTFVDAAKTLRPWGKISGEGEAPVDARGYPTTDAYTVLFDYRPVPAWNPPIDDPDGFQLDMSGVYKLSLRGQADISPREGAFTIENKTYDPDTNTTRADIAVTSGSALVVLNFTNTKRLPGDEFGTGFTDLKIIRPGYPEDTAQVFTDAFIQSLEPFSTLRFMDWLATNDNNPNFWDAGSVTHWSDRRLPDYATQAPYEAGNKYGYAWEYIVELANLTYKDIWINIPAEADGSYIQQLAQLLNSSLDEGIKVYLEYSNEVWNWAFHQATFNQNAAEAEVASGGSTLNSDGSTDQYEWGRRRFAKRSIEISQIFAGVFGQAAINDRIRVVYTWQPGQTANVESVLQWADSVYSGSPSDYLYAYSIAPYYNFNPGSVEGGASVDDILSGLSASSAQNITYVRDARKLSDKWGLQLVAYEGGPSTGNIGSTQDVGNIIRANRDPRIKDIMVNDLKNVWFGSGGGLYMHFSQVGYYSRYGCWGLTEDVTDTDTPKYQAIHEVAASEIPEYVPPTPGQPGEALTGTTFGSETDNTAVGYAFDGDTGTYYSGGKSSYIGIDLGAGNQKRIEKLRFFARGTEDNQPWLKDRASGIYEGSVDGETYTTLTEIDASQIQFGWNEVAVSDAGSYRYLRFVSSQWFDSEMAEIEFYAYEDTDPEDPGTGGEGTHVPVAVDNAMYNFENDIQGFISDSQNASLTVDNTKSYDGQKSLKYTFTGNSIMHVIPEGGIPVTAGTVVKFRVYVPEGYSGVVQPFVHNGTGWDTGGWNYFGGTDGLAHDKWIELSVIYTGTGPSPELGVKVQPEGSSEENIWVDSITYDGYVPESGNDGSGQSEDDGATYNFEDGTPQGFSMYFGEDAQGNPRPEDDSCAVDMSRAYAGSSSLRVDYNGYAYLNNQPAGGIQIPAGSEVSFRIFVPEGFTGTIDPFILDNGWGWTGAPTDSGQLTKNAWNEIKLSFNGASPCQSLVVEINSQGSGSIWVDSITIDAPQTDPGEIPETAAEAEISVDKNVQYQKIDGFGAFGGSTPNWGSQSSLYTDDFLNMIIGDLGASIIRTELSGNFEKYNDNDDPDVTDLSKFNIDTHYGEDQEQSQLRPWLDYVKAAKAKAGSLNQPLKVITTVWSPPYWMKYMESYAGQDSTWNRLSKGVGPVPGATGTKANMYPEYAEYLYAYTQIFKRETGFDLYGLSLQNEPAFAQPFPSAVYSAEQYRDMLTELGRRLKKENVDVKLFGAEDVQVQDRIKSYLDTTADSMEARHYLDIMAVHGYSADGITSGDTDEAWVNTGKMASEYNYPLWMTETSGYDNTWNGALKLANSIQSSLYSGHVSAWLWWMYTGGDNDNFTLIKNGIPTKKYYTSKNFYKFVRPGAVMVKTTSDNAAVKATAFNDSGNGTFTIVMINNAAEEKETTLTMNGANLPDSFNAYLTSETEDCSLQGTVNADDTIILPARSVMTLTGTLPGADTGIAPVINSQPEDLSVTEGQTAQFSVDANGTPDLVFQWYKNGLPVEGETGRIYRIKAADLADNGAVITVKITNNYGEVTSREAVLSVSAFEGLKIDRTDTAPVIDGTIDGSWDDIQAYELEQKVIGTPEPDNFSGSIKTAWDEDYLYLLYNITDNAVLADKDDVELFFDSDNSKGASYDGNDYQFVFKYGSTAVDETKRGVTNGVEYATAPKDGGFIVEARVPWQLLQVTPEIGKMMGLDFAADDTDVSDRDSKIAWNTDNNDIWQNPSYMGTGKLIGSGAAEPEDAEAPVWQITDQLSASEITRTSVGLTWPEAADNFGVVKYYIYNGETLLVVLEGIMHSYTVEGLTAGTSYTFGVIAEDAAGNKSAALRKSVTTAGQKITGGGQNPASSHVTSIVSVNGDIISVKPNVTGTSAGFVIERSYLDNAFNAAEADEKDVRTISVNVEAIKGVKEYSLQLPAGIFSGKDKCININTPLGTVTVTNDMFRENDIKDAVNAGISIRQADADILAPKEKEKIGSRPVIELDAIIDGKVTPWKNNKAPVTVSIDYISGPEENPDAVVVWYIDENGRISPVPNGKYDPATGRVNFTTTHLSKYAIAYNLKTYVDTGKYKWAQAQIEMAASKEIMTGITETEFGPEKSITRAEFLDAMIKTLGLTADFDGNFTDVDSSEDYYDSVGVAKELGITYGVGKGKFNPDSAITRQEMATLVLRALKVMNKVNAIGTASDLEKYSDASNIAGYAVETMATLVKEGILIGSGKTINPTDNLSKAQAAVILYKIYHMD